MKNRAFPELPGLVSGGCAEALLNAMLCATNRRASSPHQALHLQSDRYKDADEDEERSTTPDDEGGQRHVLHESEAVSGPDQYQGDDR